MAELLVEHVDDRERGIDLDHLADLPLPLSPNVRLGLDHVADSVGDGDAVTLHPGSDGFILRLIGLPPVAVEYLDQLGIALPVVMLLQAVRDLEPIIRVARSGRELLFDAL